VLLPVGHIFLKIESRCREWVSGACPSLALSAHEVVTAQRPPLGTACCVHCMFSLACLWLCLLTQTPSLLLESFHLHFTLGWPLDPSVFIFLKT
jgi:hypothetical protein